MWIPWDSDHSKLHYYPISLLPSSIESLWPIIFWIKCDSMVNRRESIIYCDIIGIIRAMKWWWSMFSVCQLKTISELDYTIGLRITFITQLLHLNTGFPLLRNVDNKHNRNINEYLYSGINCNFNICPFSYRIDMDLYFLFIVNLSSMQWPVLWLHFQHDIYLFLKKKS